MTLTKQEIIAAILEKLSFPKNRSSITSNAILEKYSFSRNQAQEVIETLMEIIKRTLEDGEDVLISGFGKFQVRDKDKRRGRNPATGEDMILEERRVVTFKCSGQLKNKLNQPDLKQKSSTRSNKQDN